MQTKLTKVQKELVEKAGVFFQKGGLPPATARILSLLMIVDEAELTFEEICAALKLSKSAVSTAINSLLIMERIEFYTKPGDRKRYFFVNPLKNESDNDGILKKIASSALMYREILAARSKANPKYNSDLRRLIEFTEFLNLELSESLRKWKKSK